MIMPVAVNRTKILCIIPGKLSSNPFARRVHHWSHGSHVHSTRTNWFCLDIWTGITF